MRIAVDARELCGRPTGVGRYLRELLHEWAADPRAGRHEWRLYAHQMPAVPDAYRDRVRILPGAGGTRWEQTTFARALAFDRPDVLFAPGYTAPLTAPCPIALTVHDVSFAAHPEWFSVREGLRRRVVTRWSARRARVVLTVSCFSRDEIVRHLAIPESRIRVIAHGIRMPAPPEQPTERRPMVLFVGSLFARRNILPLRDAFLSRVAPAVPDATLVFVGENRMHPPCDISATARGTPDQRARIVLKSYVDDDELRRLYASASVFAFLSEYEGFGMTPVEALAAGVPPLVLDTPVAREVYGLAARYVPGGAALDGALGDALLDLLTNAAARAELMAHAPDVLARYRWERAAAETLDALEEAAGA